MYRRHVYGMKRDSKQFPFDFLFFLDVADANKQRHEVFAISLFLIIIFYDDLDAEEKLGNFLLQNLFLIVVSCFVFPTGKEKKLLKNPRQAKKGRGKSFIIIIRQ